MRLARSKIVTLRPLLFIAVTTTAGLFGCGRVLGTSDYTIQSSRSERATPESWDASDDAGQSPHVTIAVGGAPYSSSECEACIAANCDTFDAGASGTRRARCSDDPFCRQWLARLQQLHDPNDAIDLAAVVQDQGWDGLHGGTDQSGIQQAFLDCTSQNCLSECALGRDFSCAGSFDWSASSPRTIRTEILAGYLDTVPDPPLNLRLCPTALVDCSAVLSQATTDPGGFAVFALPAMTPPTSLSAFLYADRTTQFPPFVGSYSNPFIADGFQSWYPFSLDLIQSWYRQFNLTFDDTSVMIEVYPFDCRGLRAKGVAVEAWLDEPNGVHQCDECAIAYEGDGFVPDFRLQGLVSQGALAYIVNAKAQSQLIIVERMTPDLGGAIVGVHRLSLLPGAAHYVHLFPYPRASQSLVDAIQAVEASPSSN
ncbi:MAG TPA: hypothetical protein VHC69_19605 [Polyangiaceae bacterium]|nr:hypothetical protein [Polyangiaceae bacterium]